MWASHLVPSASHILFSIVKVQASMQAPPAAQTLDDSRPPDEFLSPVAPRYHDCTPPPPSPKRQARIRVSLEVLGRNVVGPPCVVPRVLKKHQSADHFRNSSSGTCHNKPSPTPTLGPGPRTPPSPFSQAVRSHLFGQMLAEVTWPPREEVHQRWSHPRQGQTASALLGHSPEGPGRRPKRSRNSSLGLSLVLPDRYRPSAQCSLVSLQRILGRHQTIAADEHGRKADPCLNSSERVSNRYCMKPFWVNLPLGGGVMSGTGKKKNLRAQACWHT